MRACQPNAAALQDAAAVGALPAVAAAVSATIVALAVPVTAAAVGATIVAPAASEVAWDAHLVADLHASSACSFWHA